MRNTAKGSILAYLDSEKSFRWVVGMIQTTGISEHTLAKIMNELKGYGNQSRYQKIVQTYNLTECKECGSIVDKGINTGDGNVCISCYNNQKEKVI